MPTEVRIKIRWRDVDNYGHVNNAVYLTYLEECRDLWVRQTMASIDDRWDFVIVRVAIDYRSELGLDDSEVLVRCRGAGFGRASIRTREEIRKPDGSLAAESESVIVAHDQVTRRARPLTDEEKEVLSAELDAVG